MIRIWYFYEAPEEFQKLSGHGGDEDYLMHVSADYQVSYLPELIAANDNSEIARVFGICDVSKHELKDGSTVYIGTHA
jgi:hypothetical protein